MIDYDIPQIIERITVMIIPALLAITVHEAAHAYAAYRLGDDTAKRMGRMSLNPAVHIDPIGTIILPILTSLGGFFFGWAKPVPVMASRLRNPAKDMPMVALAGPVANVVMALIWAVILLLLNRFMDYKAIEFFYKMAQVGVRFNLILFAFNMLPLLPLDGGRVLVGLLPATVARHLVGLEQYGMIIIMALAFMAGGVLFDFWINPIVGMVSGLIDWVTLPLRLLLS